MESQITLPLTVMVEGTEYQLFEIRYNDIDGREFGFHIYATSFEHASYLLEDIKKTGRMHPYRPIGVSRQ